jgi:hypothetical protein
MGTQMGSATGHPKNASENAGGRAKARQPVQSARDKESFVRGKVKKEFFKIERTTQECP